jgi:ParB-like chromosome segregation protein Spo0J
MSSIKKVKLSSIHANHLRDLHTYPWIEPKVASLMRSINEVGLWESIIARPIDTGFEIAFGHHRIEAAKRLGLTEVPLIIKDLTDKEMLQYMGRENGDDYATDFLIMLNTWEACVLFLKNQDVISLPRASAVNLQPIEIARILGWTRFDLSGIDQSRMSDVAEACALALPLINEGQMKRDDFTGLSVRDVRQITQRANQRIQQIADLGRISQRPAAEIKRAQDTVVKGAVITARQVRDGEVKKSDVGSAVEVNAYKVAQEEKQKPSPLFEVFGVAVANQINKLLQNDALTEKLEELIKFIPSVVMEEDSKVIRRINFELGELGNRTVAYQKKLIPNSTKIVSIHKQIEGK